MRRTSEKNSGSGTLAPLDWPPTGSQTNASTFSPPMRAIVSSSAFAVMRAAASGLSER